MHLGPVEERAVSIKELSKVFLSNCGQSDCEQTQGRHRQHIATRIGWSEVDLLLAAMYEYVKIYINVTMPKDTDSKVRCRFVLLHAVSPGSIDFSKV